MYPWSCSISWCLAEKHRSALPYGTMWLGKYFTFDTPFYVGHLEAHRACRRRHQRSSASTWSHVHHSKSRQRHDERWKIKGLWGEKIPRIAILVVVLLNYTYVGMTFLYTTPEVYVLCYKFFYLMSNLLEVDQRKPEERLWKLNKEGHWTMLYVFVTA